MPGKLLPVCSRAGGGLQLWFDQLHGVRSMGYEKGPILHSALRSHVLSPAESRGLTPSSATLSGTAELVRGHRIENWVYRALTRLETSRRR
jgi:hypothetical protein